MTRKTLEDMAGVICTLQGVSMGELWRGHAVYSWRRQSLAGEQHWTISGQLPGPYLLTVTSGEMDHALWVRISAEALDRDIQEEAHAVGEAIETYELAKDGRYWRA